MLHVRTSGLNRASKRTAQDLRAQTNGHANGDYQEAVGQVRDVCSREQ